MKATNPLKKKLKKLPDLKVLLCSWIGSINMVKMVKLPKTFYRSKATLIKIPILFFTEIDKSMIHMEE
jgi:hypothetical protein